MLAFTHIPKTAGTTLNYILQKNFGSKLHAIIQRNGRRYSYQDLKNDQFLFRNAHCISGHVLKPFIDYKEFNGQLQWFTFFRDPINRYVSQYIHQQTSKNENYLMPIEKWGEKYQRSNWQTKWIAGEEDLLAAKQILTEKFVFVGITEKFDESINIMKDSFNLTLDITYNEPKMLVRNDKLKNDLLKERFDELQQFYKDQNNLDIQLYDHVVKNVFNQQQLKNKDNRPVIKLNKITESKNLLAYKIKRNLLYRPFVKII